MRIDLRSDRLEDHIACSEVGAFTMSWTPWFPGPNGPEKHWTFRDQAFLNWSSFEKERSSIGLGLRIPGGPRGTNALDVRVLDERFVWNDKTDGAVRFTQRDSIATIVIVLINIVGGFAIGVLQKGMHRWTRHGTTPFSR